MHRPGKIQDPDAIEVRSVTITSPAWLNLFGNVLDQPGA